MVHPIIQLQEECYNYSGDAVRIIRRAYSYAMKLNQGQFADLLDKELKGFEKSSDAPDYRCVHGIVRVKTYGGYVPVQLPSDIMDLLTERKITQSISEIQSLVDNSKGSMIINFEGDVNKLLCDACDFDSQYCLLIGKEQFQHILDSVVVSILEWTLLLEKQGVLGKESTFSNNDIEKAKTVTIGDHQPINFNEKIETVLIQQNSPKSIQNLNNK